MTTAKPYHLEAGRLVLETAIGKYPNTQALHAGRIASNLITLDVQDVPVIIRAFASMVRELRYAVSEMAVATFLQAKAYDKQLVLLPIVIAARFQQHAFRAGPTAIFAGRKTLWVVASACALIARRPACGCAASWRMNTACAPRSALAHLRRRACRRVSRSAMGRTGSSRTGFGGHAAERRAGRHHRRQRRAGRPSCSEPSFPTPTLPPRCSGASMGLCPSTIW